MYDGNFLKDFREFAYSNENTYFVAIKLCAALLTTVGLILKNISSFRKFLQFFESPKFYDAVLTIINSYDLG